MRSGDSLKYTGTVTAPEPLMAKSAVCHSGQLGAKIPTRSPDFTPSSTKVFANPATRRRNSCDEMGSHTPLRRNICARGDGHSRTARKNCDGSDGYPMETVNLPWRVQGCNAELELLFATSAFVKGLVRCAAIRCHIAPEIRCG